MKKLLFVLLTKSCLAAAGCAAVVVGAGAGVGAVSYVKGEVKKTYPVSLDSATQASLAALESLKIDVTQQKADGIEAIIEGKRIDDSPITIHAVSLQPGKTEIGVRAGTVGLWDLKISELIHATIAEKL